MSGAAEAGAAYEILDAEGVRRWLDARPALRERLGGGASHWRVREVGDGNLNLVFLVAGAAGSVCVKQALPYVRAAGPSWPMSPERANYESAYYAAVAPHVGGSIPEILEYDAARYAIAMEALSPHLILRHGLIAGQRYERVGEAIGEYVARASFFTSDLALRFEEKFARMAQFAGNQPLVRITVDLIFTDPYVESPRNRHNSPALDATVAALRADAELKAAAARCGEKFLTSTQALVHGDLHSGSIMVTADDSRVIDPEFAFYGPIGFDLGAFLGNLLLNWYAQAGLATAEDDRIAYRGWILDQARRFWSAFRERFLGLWRAHPDGDAWPRALFASPADAAALEAARNAYVDALFGDMLAFAGCKMIRRIVGFAHVLDLDGIADTRRRAACERAALAMARRLLTRTREFGSIDDVLAAVAATAPRTDGPAEHGSTA